MGYIFLGSLFVIGVFLFIIFSILYKKNNKPFVLLICAFICSICGAIYLPTMIDNVDITPNNRSYYKTISTFTIDNFELDSYFEELFTKTGESFDKDDLAFVENSLFIFYVTQEGKILVEDSDGNPYSGYASSANSHYFIKKENDFYYRRVSYESGVFKVNENYSKVSSYYPSIAFPFSLIKQVYIDIDFKEIFKIVNETCIPPDANYIYQLHISFGERGEDSDLVIENENSKTNQYLNLYFSLTESLGASNFSVDYRI